MRDVFISYSRRNSRRAARIVRDLEDHGITVWQDIVELTPGVSTHKTIEAGIEDARYFCFLISTPSLESYYVREVEFEQAFTRLIEERRSSYILPVVIDRVDSNKIPRRIRHLYRVDMTSRSAYSKNMRELVKTIRGSNNFTGEKWFKNLNISNLGEPCGEHPVAQMSTLGMAYKIIWDGGTVIRVDVYNNGRHVHYKKFTYDSDGRVIENRMFSPDGNGGWHVVDDVWYYEYDPKTGVRSRKIMRYDGEATYRFVMYTPDGLAIEERVATDPGRDPDRSYKYSLKVFDYDTDQNQIGYTLYDAEGELIDED